MGGILRRLKESNLNSKMGMISKGYLILYNLTLTVGWAYVLWLTFENRQNHKKMYPVVRLPLQIFQTAAVMEVRYVVFQTEFHGFRP